MISYEIRAELSETGLDCTEMIRKFMDSEEMFLKYFKKFFAAADSVVEELRAAVGADDTTAIENRAHALKGLSGNIGLGGVFDPAKKIVDDVRMGNFSTYNGEFSKLLSAYEKARAVAAKLD